METKFEPELKTAVRTGGRSGMRPQVLGEEEQKKDFTNVDECGVNSLVRKKGF